MLYPILGYQAAAKPFGPIGGGGVWRESVIASLREAPLSLRVLWALTKPDQTSKCRQALPWESTLSPWAENTH